MEEKKEGERRWGGPDKGALLYRARGGGLGT